jgi:hypothetical protein
MKLSKNYSQVAKVSKAVLTAAKEQSFEVGQANYTKQECIIKLGSNNADPNKVLAFLYFKGQKTYITSLANLPSNLLIEEGESISVVEKSVVEIKEGKILS